MRSLSREHQRYAPSRSRETQLGEAEVRRLVNENTTLARAGVHRFCFPVASLDFKRHNIICSPEASTTEVWATWCLWKLDILKPGQHPQPALLSYVMLLYDLDEDALKSTARRCLWDKLAGGRWTLIEILIHEAAKPPKGQQMVQMFSEPAEELITLRDLPAEIEAFNQRQLAMATANAQPKTFAEMVDGDSLTRQTIPEPELKKFLEPYPLLPASINATTLNFLLSAIHRIIEETISLGGEDSTEVPLFDLVISFQKSSRLNVLIWLQYLEKVTDGFQADKVLHVKDGCSGEMPILLRYLCYLFSNTFMQGQRTQGFGKEVDQFIVKNQREQVEKEFQKHYQASDSNSSLLFHGTPDLASLFSIIYSGFMESYEDPGLWMSATMEGAYSSAIKNCGPPKYGGEYRAQEWEHCPYRNCGVILACEIARYEDSWKGDQNGSNILVPGNNMGGVIVRGVFIVPGPGHGIFTEGYEKKLPGREDVDAGLKTIFGDVEML